MPSEKISWDDKATLIAHPEIDHINKVIAEDMNEIKQAVNSNADLLPIHLYSDSDGYITDSSLDNVYIGSIMGVGPVVYFEYNDPNNLSGDFSKDIGEHSIMIANTHDKMQFQPSSMFTLYKR